jgi:membrane protein DedA with SNARE-associated domain
VSLTELLHEYGYLAILVGTFAEGETILIMGGFAAHQGYLALPWVMVCAFAGSLCGDQLAFFAGRRYGGALLTRFPRLRPGVERATALLARRGTPLLLGFRFIYGIRNVVPLAAGLSPIPFGRFVLLNAAGAATWSAGVGVAGYAFGHAFTRLLDRARTFEEHALSVIAVAGLLVAGGHFILSRVRRVQGRREKR